MIVLWYGRSVWVPAVWLPVVSSYACLKSCFRREGSVPTGLSIVNDRLLSEDVDQAFPSSNELERSRPLFDIR